MIYFAILQDGPLATEILERTSWERTLRLPNPDLTAEGELGYLFGGYVNRLHHKVWGSLPTATYRFDGVMPPGGPKEPPPDPAATGCYHLAFRIGGLEGNGTPARHAQRWDDHERALCGTKLDYWTSTRFIRGEDRPQPVYLIDCKRCRTKVDEGRGLINLSGVTGAHGKGLASDR
jgi:hypothetical protein